MAFSNGQLVQAADLNNLSVTSVTTTGDITAGDDLVVTDDASIGGDLTVTGTLTVGGQAITGATKDAACGRLTLTSGTPVTTTDVTAAGTLYYALYNGNEIALYTGSAWQAFSISELSIAVPAVANQVYDVFVNYNGGTPALALTAWTNDTTRATALTRQNGVLVKSGTPTQRYVGTVRTRSASQLNDSELFRHVWNYYNQVPRKLERLESTATWTYSTATVRQANGSTSNQVDVVVGVAAETILDLSLNVLVVNDGSNRVSAGIGEDSTTTYAAGATIHNTTANLHAITRLVKCPAVGRHFYSWNEWSTASGTTTWHGTNTYGSTVACGLTGSILG